MPFVNKTEELLYHARHAAECGDESRAMNANPDYHDGQRDAFLEAACVLNGIDPDDLYDTFTDQWNENRAYRMPPEE